jgi:hypothetical protein
MDTVGLRVLTKQIRDLSNFYVNNISRLSPSSKCVTAANNICRFLDVFNSSAVSFLFYLVPVFYYHVDVLACCLFCVKF